jgi:tRNA wybutosine-synthesizing protein 3
VDAPILNLLDFLNADPRFVSTSSCSGRIAVYAEADELRKQTGEWLFTSHDPVDAAGVDAIVAAVEGGSKRHPGAAVLFKFEPFVLHMSCASLANGQLMLKTALAAGYKNSGMIVSKKRIIVVRLYSARANLLCGCGRCCGQNWFAGAQL